VLGRFRTSGNSTSRLDLATTLCLLEPSQPEAIDFLVNVATNLSDPLHNEAFWALGVLGTNARSAATLIAPLIEQKDSWHLASRLLLAIGEIDSGLKHVEKWFGPVSDWRGMQMALLVIQHDNTHEWAITNLIEVAQDQRCASILKFQREGGELSKGIEILIATGQQISTNQNHPYQEKAMRMVHLIETAPPLR
jgi:hypothetical protein